MVRISDARTSGTPYGTVVLHVCPESAAGGALAFVKDGDFIELDVPCRSITLDISEDELNERRSRFSPPMPVRKGGYQSMYIAHVMQACHGADLDFLVGCPGSKCNA